MCERIYTFKDIFEQHVAVWLFTGVSISYKQQCLFDLQFKRVGSDMLFTAKLSQCLLLLFFSESSSFVQQYGK